MLPRTEILLIDLCDEIDNLKEEVLYWKNKYEEKNKKLNEVLDSSIKSSFMIQGNLIKAILDGDIIIKEK